MQRPFQPFQLGTELRHLLDERNEDYVAVDVAEMD
ncbi:NAD(P)-dependent oxidoreductase, partial [Streptococcus gordonii]